VVLAVRDARVGQTGGVPPAADPVIPQVLDD